MKSLFQTLLALALAGLPALEAAAQCSFDPTVNGNLLVCPQSATVLGTQSYDSYQWYRRSYSGGIAEPIPGATGPTLTVDYNDTPVYISVAATQGGCTEQSPEVLVDGLVFLPVTVMSTGEFDISPVGEQIICVGDTIFQILLPPYSTIIQWYDDQSPISGANNDTLVVTQPGLYWVTASPAECPDYVAALGVQIPVVWGTTPGCTTGTHAPGELLGAFVAPNPAQTSVLISVDENDPVRFSMFDASGLLVRSGEFRVATEIFTDGLPAGVYTVHLQMEDKRATKRVVVQAP